jgi:alpha-tubulin suppressor-like RCC1 family protein/endonuclease/exonuclease/phosphatase family metal-dependent hydrolase
VVLPRTLGLSERRPQGRVLLSTVLTVGLLLAGLAVAQARTSPDGRGAAVAVVPVAASTCADVLLVGMSGSHDRAGGGQPFGSALEPARQAFLDRATGGRVVEQVRIGGKTQPAQELRRSREADGPTRKAVSKAGVRRWTEGLTTQVDALVDRLAQREVSCPDQQVVLMGYAQGAMAVHRGLLRLASAHPTVAERLVAAVLVADGDRTSGTSARRAGKPRAGTQAKGVQQTFLRATTDVPGVDTPLMVWSVCSRGDIACDIGPTTYKKALDIHRSYGDATDAFRGVADSVWTRTTMWARPDPDWQPPEIEPGAAVSIQVPVLVRDSQRPNVVTSATTALPPGLVLGSDGMLTGTAPAQEGDWTVGYSVRNTGSATYDRPIESEFTVRVRSDLSRSLAAGGEHTCVVNRDGEVWCWGQNAYGQVGNGDRGPGPKAPMQVGSRTDWQSVAAGGADTCGIRQSGKLFCWGLNNEGQLGVGDKKVKTEPKKVAGYDWRQVSLGWFTSCGVQGDHTAWCWGDNSGRQIGDGTNQQRLKPVRVKGGNWASVSVGFRHACGIKTDGSLWCWGRNTFGQVGNGTVTDVRKPTRIGTADNWSEVSASFSHTCGVRGTEVRCWGRNSRGQLGDGTRADRSVATPVPGLPAMDDVVAAEGSSCGLDDQSRLWCWGSNAYGALGNGEAGSSNDAVRGNGTYKRLSAGWMHVCGVTQTNATTCWGNNERGQIGDATVTDRREPTGPSWPDGSSSRSSATETRPSYSLGTTTTSRPSAARKREEFSFRIASFNVLGDVHTRPYTHDDEYAPSRIRAEWSRDLFSDMGSPDVIGMQEVEASQLNSLVRATGGQYKVWPGTRVAGGVQQSLMWDKSVWKATKKDYIRIPFIRFKRAQPVVRLQHRATGRSIWVINAHNAPRNLQSQRNEAVRKEIAKIKKLRRSGTPVFFVGDLNEKERVFCKVVGKTDLYSPLGGRVSKSGCTPPKGMRVDWMFGSKDVRFKDFSMYVSPLKRWVNDHMVPVSTVRVP